MADIEVGQNRPTLVAQNDLKKATPAAIAAGFKDAKDPFEGTKGVMTKTGDASAVTFTQAHGLLAAPSGVSLTARTQVAAAIHWVSARDATTFTVSFASAPASAANNIVFDWVAFI